MQNADWIKHKLESRLQGEISITSDTDDITLMSESEEELEPLDEGERGEWKSQLKAQHSKAKIMASGLTTSQQTDGYTMETLTDFILRGSKITAYGDFSHEIKRHLLLGRKAMNNLHSILKSRHYFVSKGLFS